MNPTSLARVGNAVGLTLFPLTEPCQLTLCATRSDVVAVGVKSTTLDEFTLREVAARGMFAKDSGTPRFWSVCVIAATESSPTPCCDSNDARGSSRENHSD